MSSEKLLARTIYCMRFCRDLRFSIPKEKIHVFENLNGDIFVERARKSSKNKFWDILIIIFVIFKNLVCFQNAFKMVNYAKMAYF